MKRMPAERAPGGGWDARLWNRRRAVTCLAAAFRKKDAAERNELRRRAAELILSNERTPPLAARRLA
jgi:hypothetical protein